MLICVEDQHIACSDSRTSAQHHLFLICPVGLPWCSQPPLEHPLFSLFSRPLCFDPERVSLCPMLLAFLVIASTNQRLWMALTHTNLETPGFLLQRIPVLCQFHWKPPIGVWNYVQNGVLLWILSISSTMTDALLITGCISFASSTVNHAHSSPF